MFYIPNEFLNLDQHLSKPKTEEKQELSFEKFLETIYYDDDIKLVLHNYYDGVRIENPYLEVKEDMIQKQNNESITGNVLVQNPIIPTKELENGDLDINGIFLKIQSTTYKNTVLFPQGLSICCFWNYIGIKNLDQQINFNCTFSHIVKTKNEMSKNKLLGDIQRLLPSTSERDTIIASCKNATIDELQEFIIYLNSLKSKRDLNDIIKMGVSIIGGIIENMMKNPIKFNKFLIPSLTGIKDLMVDSIMSSSWVEYTNSKINKFINGSKNNNGINIRKDSLNFLIKFSALLYTNYKNETIDEHNKKMEQEALLYEKKINADEELQKIYNLDF